MDKKIKRTAMRFYKSLKGKLTSQAVITALNTKGFDVIFYNTPEGDKALKAYGLYEYSQTVDAFTYCNKTKIVFIKENLSESDRLRTLLHEVGHIELGHLNIEYANQSDNRILEAESDAFMLEVMSPTRSATRTVIAISVLIIFLSFICGYNLHTPKLEITPAVNAEVQQASKPTVQQVIDPVYITRTGSKYHRKDCASTKDKVCAEIDRTQADILFLPCSLCNP